jgi:23S rRNA (guanine2445-N2)-methyltransferase / 23S rRNA (guanine2069-N7)-methyltransferase
LILTAACAFGLEAILKRELIALGYEPRVAQPGRVSFEGQWADVARTNVFLRTADRLLIEIQHFAAPDFDVLFETVKQFDWSQFIPQDAQFPVVGKSRLSKLTSLPAVQRSVKRALVESLKRYHGCELLPESGAMYKVEIALLNDFATLTIDTTGPSLHKRGYRQLVGEAPIKETLAAALVDLSVWKSDRPLVDPFCGSGTIPVEAALAALNVAPGSHRQFACSLWPQIEPSHWKQTAVEAADAQIRNVELQISGFDIDADVLKLARLHAHAAGVEKHIHFQQRPFAELRSKSEYGCLITNPPYGERLSQQKELLPLYESIPMVLQRLPTWSHFILTSMPRFEKIVQQRATRRRKLFNGRIECTYYQFLGPKPPRGGNGPAFATGKIECDGDTEAPFDSQLPAAIEKPSPSPAKSKPDTAPVFAGLQPKDRQQAELFRSRLVKRARHLRRWPTKRGITCYRIYERDIPELPFVVDRYEDFLHITEYERPHERDLARHAAWLELMAQTAASALELPIQKVFLKSRRKTSSRDPGKSQYTKLNEHGKLREVHEGGLKFLVNLSDYVDTGLFLDHRITRQMVRNEAADRRFLNLFAYTGAFSVYAAAGGARATTTVDLSRNYLDWASKNMKANGFAGAHHQYIALDVLTFIENEKRRAEKYDLAVVDPPTYSNSKRTDQDWDVQKHHAQLLISLCDCLADQATVYFSANLRTMRLDESALSSRYSVRDITSQTIPEDFRNKRIHRCWKLIKRQ